MRLIAKFPRSPVVPGRPHPFVCVRGPQVRPMPAWQVALVPGGPIILDGTDKWSGPAPGTGLTRPAARSGHDRAEVARQNLDLNHAQACFPRACSEDEGTAQTHTVSTPEQEKFHSARATCEMSLPGAREPSSPPHCTLYGPFTG